MIAFNCSGDNEVLKSESMNFNPEKLLSTLTYKIFRTSITRNISNVINLLCLQNITNLSGRHSMDDASL